MTDREAKICAILLRNFGPAYVAELVNDLEELIKHECWKASDNTIAAICRQLRSDGNKEAPEAFWKAWQTSELNRRPSTEDDM